MSNEKGGFKMFLFSFWLVVTVLISCMDLLPGAAAVNSTEEADAEGQQLWQNVTDVQTPQGEVTGGEATEEVAAEDGATEEVATEDEATEEGASEGVATETTSAHNVTRAQAFKEWGGRLLATKYMGSLAVLYIALCFFLAIKQGPLFIR